MSTYRSAVRRASAMPANAPDMGSGLTGRDRRRLGSGGRTRGAANRVPHRAPMNGMAATEAPHEAWDGLAQTTDDGLDPAFDEIGQLHDHVDGLSSWMRLGLAHPGGHDD